MADADEIQNYMSQMAPSTQHYGEEYMQHHGQPEERAFPSPDDVASSSQKRGRQSDKTNQGSK